MIVKPTQMNFETKKIAMIIAGLPGTGKTTLALSAPKPLLIDLDKGVDRVEVLYRKDTLFVDSYEDLSVAEEIEFDWDKIKRNDKQ